MEEPKNRETMYSPAVGRWVKINPAPQVNWNLTKRVEEIDPGIDAINERLERYFTIQYKIGKPLNEAFFDRTASKIKSYIERKFPLEKRTEAINYAGGRFNRLEGTLCMLGTSREVIDFVRENDRIPFEWYEGHR
jgi:hypothetical protein